jgi:thioredoxin reductase (NADPH)
MNRLSYIILTMVVALGAGFYWYTKQKGSMKHTSALDIKKALDKKNIVPVAVIGSGPAGLSAALYTARASLYTVVFQGKTPGGQLTGTTYVENWPGTPKLLGSQLIDINRKQAEKFGAIMVNDTIESVDFSSWPYALKTEDGQQLYALAVIIATGANPRLLNDTKPVRGEKEYWGYGVTTCAVCDAPFYKDKKVVVIGGGDSAAEEAMLLSSYAKEVTMLVRGAFMRAAPAMRDRLKTNKKIKILYNTEVGEILGDGKTVNGIELINNKENTRTKLPIDGVFLAIGHKPNTEIFKNYISTDDQGYIILKDRSQATSLSGVFAAGDVTDKVYRQAGVAAGDGIKAALDAYNFLLEQGFTDTVARQIEKSYYDPHPDVPAVKLQKIVTNKDFDELAKLEEPLVVDVGADYCPSCKVLLPVVETVAAQLQGKALFRQIDLDDNPTELVKRFNLQAIPVLLIFKKGKLVSRYDQQLFTKRELYNLVNQVIMSDEEKKNAEQPAQKA